MHDDALMHARPWCWLRDLIIGLLSANTRLARHFAPPPDEEHISID